ncbi:hypothetical protein ACLETS_23165 [Enterobacter ludwigii]|uniref:hypothetical protein n=1 Tax=Enterobacter ludwigii TaxID=299767 RepID=UPI0039759C82
MVEKILISKDNYLFGALKEFIRDLNFFNNESTYSFIEDFSFNGKNLCVLVDNRVPFIFVKKFMFFLMELGYKVKIIVLVMREVAFYKKGFHRIEIFDMRREFNSCANSIISSIEKTMQMKKITGFMSMPNINELDLDIFELSKSGMDIREISSRLNMPVKRIYFHRERLYKGMGFSNYHQSSIFMLRNRIAKH